MIKYIGNDFFASKSLTAITKRKFQLHLALPHNEQRVLKLIVIFWTDIDCLKISTFQGSFGNRISNLHV